MCGIAGIASPVQLSDDVHRRMREATRTLIHRGPDGEGFLQDTNVSLGHRRLSIIDLAGGDQPIYNEDRSIGIVFNGEIYNFKELRNRLLKNGHTFRTQSDTEVIVHLYEELGPACVEHLNGMFAFAIWDGRKKRLFAARDRLGEKPFHYQINADGELLFASELKAIRHFSGPLDISSDSLEAYLAYGYIPTPLTIYKDVHKLPAAHTLVWEDGRTTISRYWSPPNRPSERVPEDAQLLDELKDLLVDSIRIRLRSDVPVGAFLSGGIDSSLIVALASDLNQNKLATYSVGFSEADFDESEHARTIAEHFGTEHHAIHVQDLSLDMFPALVRQFDEPFADPSSIPTYYVTQAASRDLKVCLSGDAGDELFGGYPQYVPETAERLVDAVPLAIRQFLLGPAANALPEHARGKGWLRRMSVSGAQRYQRVIGVFDSEEIAALMPGRQAGLVGAEFAKFFTSATNVADSRMRCDLATYLVDDILVKVDRNSMLNSLEVRVPLLDHRLVEFAMRLPIDRKIRNGIQKWPLKELLKPLVPPGIVGRPKQGFGMPIRDWLRGTYRDMAGDLLLSPGSRARNYLDQATIARYFRAHQQSSRDLSDRLWSLLWFEQWCRENNA